MDWVMVSLLQMKAQKSTFIIFILVKWMFPLITIYLSLSIVYKFSPDHLYEQN